MHSTPQNIHCGDTICKTIAEILKNVFCFRVSSRNNDSSSTISLEIFKNMHAPWKHFNCKWSITWPNLLSSGYNDYGIKITSSLHIWAD